MTGSLSLSRVISKLRVGQGKWMLSFLILLIFHQQHQVSSQAIGNYLYRHALRQGILPSNDDVAHDELAVNGNNNKDYITLDNGYEETRLHMRSGMNPSRLHGNYDENFDGGYNQNEELIASLNQPVSNQDEGDNPYQQQLTSIKHQQEHQQESERQQQQQDEKVANFPRSSSKIGLSHLQQNGLNQNTPGHITIKSRASSSSASISNGGQGSFDNVFFIGMVMAVTCMGIFIVIATGFTVHRINLRRKAAADVEYPAYGVVGPGAPINKDKEAGNNGPPVTSAGSLTSPSGDRKLAQSAQMYHYHHQKQQMIASEKSSGNNNGQHTSTSDVDSEEDENEEGDYTVYECPGLASTGEMEVKNPLFQDDITPISSPSVNSNTPNQDNQSKEN